MQYGFVLNAKRKTGYHDDFVEHKVVPSEKANQDELLFNNPLYCTKHVHNELEYYCWQCKTCFCVKCKIEDHLSHKTDPLCDVLQNDFLPTVNENLDDIQGIIKNYRDRARDIEKEKEAAIDEYNKRIREEENKANEQSKTLAWIQTVIAKMKGANLLAQVCQDGTLERVNQMTCSKAESEFRMHASRLWPWGRNTKTMELKRSVKLQNSQRATYPFTRISFVWHTIWMINHHNGHVYRYNTDGDLLGELQLNKSITKPLTVIHLNSKSGIIAANSGLYMINKQGELEKKIASGDFSDVFMVDDIVYALEYRQGKVVSYVVSYENGKEDLQKKDEILLENYENENELVGDNYSNTFIVKSESIYVAMCYNDLILHHDIIGIKRSVIASDENSFYPSVCGINKDNQLLVTNRRTKAVEWMNIDGTSDKVIDELPLEPWFAIYVDNSKVLVVGEIGGANSRLNIYNHNFVT